ncbi:hypothetical protein [Acetobacter orientalis]|uniref:hypothetical protein n=1 Tax=Acetobacter orientalis TaxID=146474 RepID=UPI0039EB9D09
MLADRLFLKTNRRSYFRKAVRNCLIGSGNAFDPNPVPDTEKVILSVSRSVFSGGFFKDSANLSADRQSAEQRMFGEDCLVTADGKTPFRI